MDELANCCRCGTVFVKNTRDICQDCYQVEEQAFRIVNDFLRIWKNREATLSEIVDATGVEENLLIKFIKEKRLLPSQFPKLAYSCEKCGTNITSGKLCARCSRELLQELETQKERQQRSRERKARQDEQASSIYFTLDRHKKNGH